MAKKSFAHNLQDNPALKFISTPEATEQQEAVKNLLDYQEEEKPKQDTPQPEANPLKLKAKKELEIRNRRVQLVIKPSVHEKVKAEAESLELSVNEFINQLIERYLEMKGE